MQRTRYARHLSTGQAVLVPKKGTFVSGVFLIKQIDFGNSTFRITTRNTTLTHYWYKHFIELSHFFHPFRPLNLKLRFLCCGCDRFTLQRFKMSSSGPVEMSECGFKTGYTARCRETWETQIPSKNHSHMKNNPKMYCL